MIFRLSRTSARRAANHVVKRHLEQAFNYVLNSESRLHVEKIAITLTPSGHYAEVEVAGRCPQPAVEAFTFAIDRLLKQKFNPPWNILGEGEKAPEPEVIEGAGSSEAVERPVGKVNLDLPEETFSRIYGRDAQIRRILDAIRIGKDTNWEKRKHTLLSGPPGTGKTELLLTLAKALGQEGESWIWFDATSTTKAGAIEQLMKSPILPPIVFVEEIEKVQENALRWLLSVMDERGEIRRTNYRVGNQVKKARLTVIATANNVAMLKAMDSAALYSRFGNRIECPAPDRVVMEKILHREVSEINGAQNQEWVDKALEFGFDQLGIRDCREILNILLCGRDRLLDGTYQKDFLETMPHGDKVDLGLEKA